MKGRHMGNHFKDEPKFVLAKPDYYPDAVIVETRHKGLTQTKYGEKNYQLFVVEVSQTDAQGKPQKARVYRTVHRSLDSKSALVRLMTALGMDTKRGQEFDFGDFVGKKFPSIRVFHQTNDNGVVSANFVPEFPPKAKVVGLCVSAPVPPVKQTQEPEPVSEPSSVKLWNSADPNSIPCDAGACKNEATANGFCILHGGIL
jgi:hypothetical protein